MNFFLFTYIFTLSQSSVNHIPGGTGEVVTGDMTTTMAAILVTASISPTDTFFRKLAFKIIVLEN